MAVETRPAQEVIGVGDQQPLVSTPDRVLATSPSFIRSVLKYFGLTSEQRAAKKTKDAENGRPGIAIVARDVPGAAVTANPNNVAGLHGAHSQNP